MLTFRNTNIFFAALILLLIWIHISYGLPVYIYPIVIVIYSVIVFYGCYYVGSNFFIKIICSADTDQKEIAITFDDGPAVSHTPEILALLKKENVTASFFCIGKRIEGNENMIRQINAEGHIIGNHSYSHHFWFDMFSSKKMLQDLNQMDEQVEQLIGLRPKLFRPPYGVTNPNLKKAIIQGHYTPVGWNVRSLDTAIKNEDKLLDKVIKAIKPGAVFLFHDTCAVTRNILPAFITEVKNSGYKIVSLDKLLNLIPYA